MIVTTKPQEAIGELHSVARDLVAQIEGALRARGLTDRITIQWVQNRIIMVECAGEFAKIPCVKCVRCMGEGDHSSIYHEVWVASVNEYDWQRRTADLCADEDATRSFSSDTFAFGQPTEIGLSRANPYAGMVRRTA